MRATTIQTRSGLFTNVFLKILKHNLGNAWRAEKGVPKQNLLRNKYLFLTLNPVLGTRGSENCVQTHKTRNKISSCCRSVSASRSLEKTKSTHRRTTAMWRLTCPRTQQKQGNTPTRKRRTAPFSGLSTNHRDSGWKTWDSRRASRGQRRACRTQENY